MSAQLVIAGALVALVVLAWPRHDRAAVLGLLLAAQPTDPTPSAPLLTTEDVTSSMVLLALALQSGCGVVEAIEHVALTSTGAPARDLGTVAAAMRWGVDERSAWETVDSAWGRAGQSLRLATRSGVAPSTLLMAGASDLRAGEMARLDVDAARVAVLMVLPLGLTFMPAFCLTSVIPIVLALARQVLAP